MSETDRPSEIGWYECQDEGHRIARWFDGTVLHKSPDEPRESSWPECCTDFRRLVYAEEVEKKVEAAIEAEQARWQQAIYEICDTVLPGVDGCGCDSGDPLDVTTTEISHVINHLKEHNTVTVAPDASRVEEVARRCWIEANKQLWTQFNTDAGIEVITTAMRELVAGTTAELDVVKAERDQLRAEVKRLDVESQYLTAKLAAAQAEVERLREGLNKIASWGEGEQVNGSFDEPASAKIARAALAQSAPAGEGKPEPHDGGNVVRPLTKLVRQLSAERDAASEEAKQLRQLLCLWHGHFSDDEGQYQYPAWLMEQTREVLGIKQE